MLIPIVLAVFTVFCILGMGVEIYGERTFPWFFGKWFLVFAGLLALWLLFV